MNAKIRMHKDGVEGYHPVSRRHYYIRPDLDINSRDMADPEDWRVTHVCPSCNGIFNQLW